MLSNDKEKEKKEVITYYECVTTNAGDGWGRVFFQTDWLFQTCLTRVKDGIIRRGTQNLLSYNTY